MSTRVLVIEDNPADVTRLRLALGNIGVHDVKLTVESLLGAAIERLKSDSFDVVLLDLTLPDSDGLDGLQKLREAARELPVVVLTGHNDSELAVRAVREGAQDYLIKGQVDGHLLVRALRYAAERKQAMLQLERNEERFRALIENALDIIAVLDANGQISYASPAVERVLGYTPAELSSRNVSTLAHPDDLPRFTSALSAAAAGGTSTVLCRLQHKDGRWRVLEAVGRSFTGDRLVSGVVVNARDVTERIEADGRLRDANTRLRTVIETSPLAIYVLDLDGRVQGWNKAAEEIFGWTAAQVLDRELPAVRPADRAEFRKRLSVARSGGEIGQWEARYLQRSGRDVEVSIWTSLLRDEQGLPTGLVAIVADVTERRRLEDQFRQAQKMEAIGRLAGGVAHDFNNLLTVIAGYSQLASNRVPADSAVGHDLREVLEAADRAAGLTRQLLTLSRRKILEPALLDLNAVVTDVERMLTRVLGEDVRLVTVLGAPLREVRADRSQLEMVLLNLAINARDAMPGGGTLTIETAEVSFNQAGAAVHPSVHLSGSYALLTISDTGIGMDERVRAHIFEPFFTTKEPGKGTGLGLSTSYGIIRQHGGEIWVDSEPGLGTTFRIYLPVAGPVPAGQEPGVRPKEAASGIRTVLLVESEPGVVGVMRAALERDGFHILEAHQAEDAVAISSTYPDTIHLLVSDSVLRQAHGVDPVRQIRALHPGIRALFVSGYPSAAAPGWPVMKPGDGILEKPFSPELLVEKVREVLSSEERSGE